MKFGMMSLFPAEGDDDHRVLRDALEEIQLADQIGFDSAWLAEHHFGRYGILGNPLVVGAAVAERTQRIRIGTAVVVVPFHNPLRLAEDAATLDVLSGGRLDLGIGRGYQPREFNGFGIDAETSRQRYAECADILTLAWTRDRFSYHGTFNTIDDVAVYPKPVQAGGPPLLHGTVSPASFAERGLAGDRIITSPTFTPVTVMKKNLDAYRAGLRSAGHDPAQFDAPYMQQVWVGDSRENLRAVAESALEYFRTVRKVVPGMKEAIAAEEEYYDKVRRHLDMLTLEKALTHGGNFGSVDQVVDTLGLLSSELGVNHYIGWFHIPSLDRRLVLEAMETFAGKVIPQLRHVTS